MSWVTVIWSMTASACLTLALMHLLIWFRQRDAWANLAFALTAIATAAYAVCELGLMRALTPAEFGLAMRWTHLPGVLLIVSMVVFVRLYLRAGRLWLIWVICVLRAVTLLLNFSMSPNIHYREITAIHHIPFLGEPVSVATAVINPWMAVPHLALILMVIYICDATITVWRRGDHRQALIVGGSILFFVFAGAAQLILILWQVVPMPVTTSLFYTCIVAAMGYELSRDALRAAQLSRELRESEHRFSLAADAAKLGIWVRDLVKNEIWATSNWRALFGFSPSQRLEFADVLNKIHPDDREVFNHNFKEAMAGGGHYETDYRIVSTDGQTRWIASRGRIEFDPQGKPLTLRGVSVDITARTRAELEVQTQRDELAHLSRVTMLGELSGSLAHELNQPLAAILSNAQAAQRFLARDETDLTEVRAILADIVEEDKRAGEVIRRLRLLLQKGQTQHQPLDINEVVQEVLKLVRNDLVNHTVSAQMELTPHLPFAKGDRVQLQQVLLNTVMNACYAMADIAPADRQLTISTTSFDERTIQVSIADCGSGIAPENLERIFKPFVTTRTEGMGMGLAICTNIINAHGGKMWAKNNPERGATFYFTLPASGNQT